MIQYMVTRTLDQLKTDFINYSIQPTNWLGDSPSRFDIYSKYAAMVDSVTEFGVYTGLSTTAFMAGNPKSLISYDITDEYISILPELYENSKILGIDFKFEIKNSLEIDINNTDLLFIDTVHTYDHCLAEINKHHTKVNKFMMFHDTTAWPGVFDAIVEFLKYNIDWHIVYHCNKNSGLMILEKYND
jgi:hypothetical protein